MTANILTTLCGSLIAVTAAVLITRAQSNRERNSNPGKGIYIFWLAAWALLCGAGILRIHLKASGRSEFSASAVSGGLLLTVWLIFTWLSRKSLVEPIDPSDEQGEVGR